MVRRIKIEKFDKSKHVKFIRKWLKIREMDKNLYKSLPDLGVVSFFDGIPVSASFIRRVEGDGFGMIDSMISDPRVDSDVRDVANDILTHNLLDLAKSLNFKDIVGFTTDKFTLVRLFNHGFNGVPHSVVVKSFA